MKTNAIRLAVAAGLVLPAAVFARSGEGGAARLEGTWSSGDARLEGIRFALTLTFNRDGTVVYDERRDDGRTRQKLRFAADGEVIRLFPLGKPFDEDEALELPFRLGEGRLILLLDEHEVVLSPAGGAGPGKTSPPPETTDAPPASRAPAAETGKPDRPADSLSGVPLAGEWTSGPLSYPEGKRSLTFAFRDGNAVAVTTERGGKANRTEGRYRIDGDALVIATAAGRELRVPCFPRKDDGALVVTFDGKEIPLRRGTAPSAPPRSGNGGGTMSESR